MHSIKANIERCLWLMACMATFGAGVHLASRTAGDEAAVKTVVVQTIPTAPTLLSPRSRSENPSPDDSKSEWTRVRMPGLKDYLVPNARGNLSFPLKVLDIFELTESQRLETEKAIQLSLEELVRFETGAAMPVEDDTGKKFWEIPPTPDSESRREKLKGTLHSILGTDVADIVWSHISGTRELSDFGSLKRWVSVSITPSGNFRTTEKAFDDHDRNVRTQTTEESLGDPIQSRYAHFLKKDEENAPNGEPPSAP